MADAQASGACSRKAVWVQVPSPAQKEAGKIKASFIFVSKDLLTVAYTPPSAKSRKASHSLS